nr:Mariner Mos1 transposase [Hymenolepis microstoma]
MSVERRLFACKQVLLKRQTQKGFLHRIVTGVDSCQKWVHCNNPKLRRKSWGLPRSRAPMSTSRPNIHASSRHALRSVGGPA